MGQGDSHRQYHAAGAVSGWPAARSGQQRPSKNAWLARRPPLQIQCENNGRGVPRSQSHAARTHPKTPCCRTEPSALRPVAREDGRERPYAGYESKSPARNAGNQTNQIVSLSSGAMSRFGAQKRISEIVQRQCGADSSLTTETKISRAAEEVGAGTDAARPGNCSRRSRRREAAGLAQINIEQPVTRCHRLLNQRLLISASARSNCPTGRSSPTCPTSSSRARSRTRPSSPLLPALSVPRRNRNPNPSPMRRSGYGVARGERTYQPHHD